MQKKLILLRKKNSFGGILAPKNRINFLAKKLTKLVPKNKPRCVPKPSKNLDAEKAYFAAQKEFIWEHFCD